jgi:hypothetical protein
MTYPVNIAPATCVHCAQVGSWKSEFETSVDAHPPQRAKETPINHENIPRATLDTDIRNYSIVNKVRRVEEIKTVIDS